MSRDRNTEQRALDQTVESGRVATMIACICVCMVASASGGLLPPFWCKWWAIYGATGFVSSVGLNIRYRLQAISLLQERERRAAQSAERKLESVVDGIRVTHEIGTAVHRIVRSVCDSMPEGQSSREATREALDCGITITPVQKPDDAAQGQFGESIPGHVRDISLKGVGLIHDRPIERGSVVLAFELEGGEAIHFIADVLWCEAREDGRYASGGKLLRLVTSADAASSGPEDQ
jgi:hypothetical protein